MKKVVSAEEIKNIYLELVIMHFDLDDPYYYCNEDTKRDLDKILTKLEKLLGINKKEDE